MYSEHGLKSQPGGENEYAHAHAAFCEQFSCEFIAAHVFSAHAVPDHTHSGFASHAACVAKNVGAQLFSRHEFLLVHALPVHAHAVVELHVAKPKPVHSS